MVLIVYMLFEFLGLFVFVEFVLRYLVQSEVFIILILQFIGCEVLRGGKWMRIDEFGLEEKLGYVFDLLLVLFLVSLENVKVFVINVVVFIFVVGFFFLKFNEDSVSMDFMVYLNLIFVEGVGG